MAKPENSLWVLVAHKLPLLKSTGQLRVRLFQRDHVSEVYGKPSRIVYVVVCKEERDECRQCLTIQSEVSLSERHNQRESQQLHGQHKIPELKWGTPSADLHTSLQTLKLSGLPLLHSICTLLSGAYRGSTL